MADLPRCSGTIFAIAKNLCRSSITVSSEIRAASSTLAARDESNILSSTATQPLSAKFQENASALSAVLEELYGKVARLCEGGGAKAVERHRSRNKLPPRERIAALLDPGSPFLELSQLAGFNLYGQCPFCAPTLPSLIVKTLHVSGVAPSNITHCIWGMPHTMKQDVLQSSEQGCFRPCLLIRSLHAIF